MNSHLLGLTISALCDIHYTLPIRHPKFHTTQIPISHPQPKNHKYLSLCVTAMIFKCFAKFYPTINADGTDSLVYSRPECVSVSSVETPQSKGMCVDRGEVYIHRSHRLDTTSTIYTGFLKISKCSNNLCCTSLCKTLLLQHLPGGLFGEKERDGGERQSDGDRQDT